MQPAREISPDIDLAALQAADPLLFPLLLNSASVRTETASPNSRWDILFCSNGESLELDVDACLRRDGDLVAQQGFLGALDNWFAEIYRSNKAADAYPFAGGWCVYLAYEFLGQLEPTVPVTPPDDGLPMALALRCPAAIVVDRALQRAWLLSEPGQEALTSAVLEHTARPVPVPKDATQPAVSTGLSEDAAERYLDAVARIREYIAAGDVFQVNLSRQWEARYPEAVAPELLWNQLNAANPAPFAGLLRWRDAALVSSSPERLVQVTGPLVQTRPIAGTRPRVNRRNDAVRQRELLDNPKERAEHIMLLDLERNDLGRICRPGTVRVDEFMGIESYAHVHHIVSNVSGRLRKNITPGKVLASVFPGGTITGCPKVRCMQIIHELEQAPRGAYTGSLGYLDCRGLLDMNILIRSLVVQGDRVRFRAGAGIVADSDPERELAETRAKARGLLRALELPDAA